MDSGVCQKNKRHERFYLVNKFTIKDLPNECQDNSVFDYIKIISELTGRVDIHFTSTDRPDVDPITNAKYPCWDTKNTRNMRTGTGTVVSVLEVRDEECPCPECEESPSRVFYLVYVLTAKHVVFDDTEARQSYFRIGYNTEKSPLHRLYGLRVVESDMNDGRSLVEYVTHESKFGIHLSDNLTNLNLTEKKIPERFHSTDDYKLAVIVSHPHGEPKHVTIGEWVYRELISTPTGVKARYFYTTDTCQGSSGAAVIVLGDMLPRVAGRPIEHHIYHTTDNDGLRGRCFRILSK
ncbi:uncharacterized protein LOC131956023 [Physella acuta]|uniref:uncharacterized protein LOC131956023 n=1 Tax=Physella acuta TaxID=109671 RepID=UPI0027DD7E8E|nr:uncharacterized protein LOC131956023 [Physella acuta]